jgi:hypothetical protein
MQTGELNLKKVKYYHRNPVYLTLTSNTKMKIVVLIFIFLCLNILQAQIVPFYSATNDKYGYKDTKGKVIIAPKYDLAYTLEEGMAAVRLISGLSDLSVFENLTGLR